ncbi:MAG: SIS domain-containing protein [Myxococcales bacterium]|nr:SIS domain-containing protein [Myxococcales bacterium]
MLAAIRALPDHFALGWQSAAGIASPFASVVRRLIVCGMGGSAFPADLLAMHLRPRGVSVHTSRDYRVRSEHLGPHALVIASSFSGNTEETLSAFEDARVRGASVIALTAGGQLAEGGGAAGVPLVRLVRPNPDFQPRAATGFFVGALARLAEDAGLVHGLEADLADVAASLRAQKDVEARADALANALVDRIPVVYAASPLADTARIIKIKFNENAKLPAFFNELPELNHNELVGFTRFADRFAAVLLADPQATPRMQRRLAMTAETLREAGLTVHTMDLPAAPPLQQAFAALHLFDFVSYRLARLAGIDPNPVALIEAFKKRLGPFPTPTD